MPIGGERAAVQNPLTKYTTEAGWTYLSAEQCRTLRGNDTGLILKDIFIEQVSKLNPFMTPELAMELSKKLLPLKTGIEGNLIVWEYIRGLRQIHVPAEKRERDVKLMDINNTYNNTFHVTDEFTYSSGTATVRADVLFLINGIPLIIVETKAAHKVEGIAEALDQIRRYHREGVELLSMLQLYTLTHLICYYYGATWNTSRKGLFNWKDEQGGDFETIVKAFFDKQRVLRTLHDYILFIRQDDELKKIVLRPHQMRAVGKAIKRALSDKKRGLIWHTQGSGKTYTMITTAKLIIENPAFNNPTVIMLVDRNELESQMFANLSSAGFMQQDVETDSKLALENALKNDKRGLIVSMIHKFDGIKEGINTRHNIYVLVDEAHRTTGGKLGNYLMGALPNATYIGFTGTPIDRLSYGQGTFFTFGKEDPPKGYLDKYGIAESIEDGTTVALHYTLAPNELLIDRETLEKEFLNRSEAAGVSDIEELNKVLAKAVNLRNMLKNPERIEEIAAYVANHFRENVEPMGYKAFLVAVDREACALYKSALDKHLPSEYSCVVYSKSQNDEEHMKSYYLSDEQEKLIRKDFRKPDTELKILIVTEKLLTGFDAPILYCMYLDKPMRDHVLLQAIARVNRPYEDSAGRAKPSGFIVDFVGLFANLQSALAFDSSDIEGVVEDVEFLKGEFAKRMVQAKDQYLSIAMGKARDKEVEAILEHFVDEKLRHKFFEFFKDISSMYDIISPDAFLRPYLDNMEALTRIFRILKEAYCPTITIDREFTRKTAQLVSDQTKGGNIGPIIGIYEINEETLKRIDASRVSDREKVFNLIKTIVKHVTEGADELPYLRSIGERADEIIHRYNEGQEMTQATINALKNLVNEINDAKREQNSKGMPNEVFSVYWLFRNEGIAEPENSANEMSEVFKTNPHWRSNGSHEREVRKKLYSILSKCGLSGFIEFGKNIMDILRGRGK
ncbi:MAG: HsdR family type I site-specific deoxyribonuclease [Nitrospirae bacterium]|nr:HsdR family type I site-specific deoxyribonuclease [Nitrospirota bacterium]